MAAAFKPGEIPIDLPTDPEAEMMRPHMDGSSRRRARSRTERTAAHEGARDAHAQNPSPVKLRLAGTQRLDDGAQDAEAMAALREACRLLEQLKLDRERLEERLASVKRLDPIRQVCGESSMDRACRETEELIRRVDELLAETAERTLLLGARGSR